MGHFTRTTKEIAFGEISAKVLGSIQTYLAKRGLVAVLNDPVMCVVSTSEKLKKITVAGPKLLIQTAILTKRWLTLADNVDQNALYIRIMQLQNITVEDYENGALYKMMPDTGVNVQGYFTDASAAGSLFIPLGKDEAGDRFKARLIEAVQKAKH